MSVLDPKQDAAALDPVVQHAITTLVAEFVKEGVPALQFALHNALDGLTVTVTIAVSRKGTA